LAVVETASFTRRTYPDRCLEWLYRITGQRGSATDLPNRLDAGGFTVRREQVPVDGTVVSVILADK
jgi:hypothetical protein